MNQVTSGVFFAAAMFETCQRVFKSQARPNPAPVAGEIAGEIPAPPAPGVPAEIGPGVTVIPLANNAGMGQPARLHELVEALKT